uniref:Uncharacterized protein n=1 Tax=Oscillatoriales cyanobacterium SpSt-402 TaxID=2282168 RepID=A0A832H2I4_9CYAN
MFKELNNQHSLIRQVLSNQLTLKLFSLFLAADLIFMILHLIHSYTTLLPNHDFSLEQDRGHSEILQYIKEYWIALLLGSLALRMRSLLYLGWSLLFTYILLDDAVEIHERVGRFIVRELGLTDAFRLRAQDFGELAITISVGLFFLVFLGVAYRLSNSTGRRVSRYLIVMLAAFAFFGVVVDIGHVAFGNPSIDPLLILLEDGGELVLMSAIVSAVFSLVEYLRPSIHLPSHSVDLSAEKALVEK